MNLTILRTISHQLQAFWPKSERDNKPRYRYEIITTGLFAFLLVLATLNVYLVHYYLERQMDDAHVVNVAGRQRMLGQKIAYFSHSVAVGVKQDRKRLATAIESYVQASSVLRHGGQIMEGSLPPIDPEFEQLASISERLSSQYLEQAKIVLQHDLKNPIFYHSLEFVQKNNEELLAYTNDVVNAYVNLKNSSEYAHEIDISGRQRMLSQKVAKYAAQIGVSNKLADREQLLAAINIFSSALDSLKNGGIEKNRLGKPAPVSVAVKLTQVEKLWRDFKQHALIIQQEPIHDPKVAEALSFISSNSETMFENDNRLTKALVDFSSNKVNNLNCMLLVLLGINAFFLIIAYLLLYKTGQALRISREKLHEYNIQLEKKVEERTRQIREVKEVAILSLAKLTESRDPETGEHLERIQRYTQILAQELMNFDEFKSCIDEQYVQNIAKSSILHDIGKVGIPDHILLKPGKLTPKEFETMKTHTTIGGEALAAADRQIGRESFLTIAKEVAFFHHEKYDGSGYQKGLKGKEIPLSARIVSLADAYDAIRSKRPYKKPLSHEFAIKEISQQAGKHFDPVVVQAFLRQETQFKRISTEFSSTLPDPINLEKVA